MAKEQHLLLICSHIFTTEAPQGFISAMLFSDLYLFNLITENNLLQYVIFYIFQMRIHFKLVVVLKMML
jgi:hypothetical protein